MPTIRFDSSNPGITRIAQILLRVIGDRTGATGQHVTQGPADVALALEPGIGSEGFRIAQAGSEIHIAGNDLRGLLYGAGQYLRDMETAARPRPASVPEKSFRCIYLASHFHNWYQDAPLEDITRYIEELGLWGYNHVMVWYDMQEFHGVADPRAQAMTQRLKTILKSAGAIGLGASMVVIANEAFADSPKNLRADWTAGHDGYFQEPMGHYHLEICPNKPGGLEFILESRRQMFEQFADVPLEAVVLWPYDQGGCTCAACKPWGANGFLKCSEAVGRLYKKLWPKGKVLLSGWYFDRFTTGEWQGVAERFAIQKPDWVDMLVAADGNVNYPAVILERGAPAGLPLIGFPEISMWGVGGWGPWGGFGASPYPNRLETFWRVEQNLSSGGFPYSEGLFEDLNKVLFARWYWQGDLSADAIVREYLAYEIGPQFVDQLTRLVELFEQTLPRTSHTEKSPARFVIHQPQGVQEAFEIASRVNENLPPRRRAAWRWQIMYLRAVIDYELVRHDGLVTVSCEECLQALTSLYHAKNAWFPVAPPTREALQAKRWG